MAKSGADIVFIAGTDTGVGKSLFTAAFTLMDRRGTAHLHRAQAKPPVAAAGYKGAASDCIELTVDGRTLRLNEDILLLALINRWPLGETAWSAAAELEAQGEQADIGTAAGLAAWRVALDSVAPQRFLLPAAPTVAARAERAFVATTQITRTLEALALDHARVYYEGIGGLMVPLDDSTLSIDHARRLADRCRLIARTGLGTINHTALSVAALQQRRMSVEALYLSHPADRPLSRVEAANASEIARVTKLPMHSIFVVEYLAPKLPRKYAKCALPPALLNALPADRAELLAANWARTLQLADWLAD